MPKDFPNGVLIFCSTELVEVVHPPRPLPGRVYSCGNHFDTAILAKIVGSEEGQKRGVIVIDGAEASLGNWRQAGNHQHVEGFAHFTSTTASRTRRGGQSALRYSRLRDGAELAFLRKVAERADASFDQTVGLVVAGKADMKRKLVAELSSKLRESLLCVVDISTNADAKGLRAAVAAAIPKAAASRGAGLDQSLGRFFESTVMPSQEGNVHCCYGVHQTSVALKLGAVDELFVDAHEPELETWKQLAVCHGTNVVEVEPSTSLGFRFCQSFVVGACLRWPVNAELLEEDAANADSDDETASVISTDGLVVVETESSDDNETIHSKQKENLMLWLHSRLEETLGDVAAAEALVACADVLFMDESTPPIESAWTAAEMLISEGLLECDADDLVERWLAATDC